MGALADLWKSERGLVAITLILAMSVLCGLGSFTGAQWIDYTQWISTVYIGSKTITGVVSTMKGVTDTVPPVTVQPAAPAVAHAAPPPPAPY